MFVQEEIEPNTKYNCDQTTFIDFPPIIAIPNDPHFPTDRLVWKVALDSIHGGGGTGGTTPDMTFEQEEWDFFLPFLLNEVMTMNQDVGYDGFTNPDLFALNSHDLNVVSWIYGHSLEGDLSIVRILAENGQNTQANGYLNTLGIQWNNHPQIVAAIDDYMDILSEIGSSRIDDLSLNTVNDLVNDYNIIRTGYGKAWIRSIAQYYDINIPITYTLPLSGQVAPRTKKESPASLIAPNPFTHTFTFLSQGEGQLYIYDLLGRPIFGTSTDKGENLIDMGIVSSGVYIYKFLRMEELFLQEN